MSKYTTEVRYLCEHASGLEESVGYNSVNTVITNAIPHIFDFDFPIFDETYRSILERKILKHYYTREICEESVGLWKLRLDARLNEIMPYFNKLYSSELLEFNPLYSVNLTRTRTTDLDSKRTESENINDRSTNNRTTSDDGTISRTLESTTEGTAESANTDLYSDTPQGDVTGLNEKTYLTNARKIDNSNTTETSGTDTESTTTSNDGTDNSTGTYTRTRGNTDNLLSTEDYLESVAGFDGTSGSELLKKYRETFLNIDMDIITELEDLFFQLW